LLCKYIIRGGTIVPCLPIKKPLSSATEEFRRRRNKTTFGFLGAGNY